MVLMLLIRPIIANIHVAISPLVNFMESLPHIEFKRQLIIHPPAEAMLPVTLINQGYSGAPVMKMTPKTPIAVWKENTKDTLDYVAVQSYADITGLFYRSNAIRSKLSGPMPSLPTTIHIGRMCSIATDEGPPSPLSGECFKYFYRKLDSSEARYFWFRCDTTPDPEKILNYPNALYSKCSEASFFNDLRNKFIERLEKIAYLKVSPLKLEYVSLYNPFDLIIRNDDNGLVDRFFL